MNFDAKRRAYLMGAVEVTLNIDAGTHQPRPGRLTPEDRAELIRLRDELESGQGRAPSRLAQLVQYDA